LSLLAYKSVPPTTYKLSLNTAAAAPDLAPNMLGKFDHTSEPGSQETTVVPGIPPAIKAPPL
jgi:hypothetical protein